MSQPGQKHPNEPPTVLLEFRILYFSYLELLKNKEVKQTESQAYCGICDYSTT